MSDSPLHDTPTPPWGLRLGEDHPDTTDVVERVRSRLLRVALVSVAVVTVLGVAGVLVIADRSRATVMSVSAVVSVSVVVGCVVVVLVAATRVAATVRVLRQSQWTGPTLAETVHPAFGDDVDQRREVFVKLARRLQSLINRAIRKVDELERGIEDPDLLRGLYEVDHLATRVRRQAENLAVLGGEAPQRRSSSPVSVYAVLRSAVAEVEHYKRIMIVPAEGVDLHGYAVAEIIHLLAELLENATTFSAPDSSKVVLRAQSVTAGLAIEVQDRGLGMTVEDLQRINRLLDGSTHIDIGELLQDGRIGLAVVKELSRRHNVRVRLQTNIFGGIDAAVVLPHSLISDSSRDSGTPRRAPQVSRGVRVGAVAPTTAAAAAGQSISGPSSKSFPAQPPDGRHNKTVGVDSSLAEQAGRPPLPYRRGQSHLRQELLEPPPAPTRPLPGHNISLMATVQQGLDRGRDEQDGTTEMMAGPPQPQSRSPHSTPKESPPHGR